jgi:IS5 family transposase
MRPKAIQGHEIFYIDRPPIEDMVDSSHPLMKLAAVMDWDRFDKKFSAFFTSTRGRPATKTRIIVGTLYLKHTYNLSDEDVVERVRENPYWQYFCGSKYFQKTPLCDATTLVKWRQKIGEAGLEELLQETLASALKIKAIKPRDLDDVTIDTTVQEKNIAFPTDAKLLERARKAVVKAAEDACVELRQNYNRESPQLVAKYARYSHAKQFNRARRMRKRLITILGRVLRDFDRKANWESMPERVKTRIAVARRILLQMGTGKDKVYSVHEPEVECISKGKAHKRYEFGCKVSVATTNLSNWIVGAKAIHGRPYDGHTLGEALGQVRRVVGRVPSAVYVDKGYRGGKPPDEGTQVFISGQRRGVNRRRKRLLRRRSAVEPVIGHLKGGHRLGRNFLKGIAGDRNNIILAAAGFNMSKLMAALFVSNFIHAFFANNLV